jgi:hypothetical protein
MPLYVLINSECLIGDSIVVNFTESGIMFLPASFSSSLTVVLDKTFDVPFDKGSASATYVAVCDA